MVQRHYAFGSYQQSAHANIWKPICFTIEKCQGDRFWKLFLYGRQQVRFYNFFTIFVLFVYYTLNYLENIKNGVFKVRFQFQKVAQPQNCHGYHLLFGTYAFAFFWAMITELQPILKVPKGLEY